METDGRDKEAMSALVTKTKIDRFSVAGTARNAVNREQRRTESNVFTKILE